MVARGRPVQSPGQPVPKQWWLRVLRGPQPIEINLGGEVIRTILMKNHQGFGFTIIGGDQRGGSNHFLSSHIVTQLHTYLTKVFVPSPVYKRIHNTHTHTHTHTLHVHRSHSFDSNLGPPTPPRHYNEEDIPKISGNIDDISSPEEEILFVEVPRDQSGFGFSI